MEFFGLLDRNRIVILEPLQNSFAYNISNKSTKEGKTETDVADNMKTQPKDAHRARHKICGDQYHQYDLANKPKIKK